MTHSQGTVRVWDGVGSRVFNGETYSLYRTNNMLSMSMNGMHVWHLDRAFEGEFTPEDMAQKIARIANGRQV